MQFFSVSAQNFHAKSETLKKIFFQKVPENGPCSFLLFFFKGLTIKILMQSSNMTTFKMKFMITNCVSILETRFFDFF